VVAFLPGEAKPRFMWATLVDEGGYMTFDAQSLFPTKERYESKIAIHHNAWTDAGLGYELHVYFTGRSPDYYPLPNQAVYTACGGLRPKFSYDFNFHGPIFAFCDRLGAFLGDPEYQHELVQAHDMDMRTYAHLIAYLTYYYNDGFASLKGPKVTCVKVACKGERNNGVPSHQAVRVPRTHPIFVGKGIPSKNLRGMASVLTKRLQRIEKCYHFFSQRLMMPLLTWKCPAPPSPLTNQHIAFMHVSCDPNAKEVMLSKNDSSFGFAPMLFQNDVGTQLVASTTKVPLSAEIVEAFGDFCQWHLTPYFQKYSEDGGDAAAPANSAKPSRQVLTQITNAKWTEYLSQWKAEKKDAAAAHARETRVYTLAKASSGLERMGVTEDDSDRLMSILCTSLESYLDLNKLRFADE
jgi:hypothetical protein